MPTLGAIPALAIDPTQFDEETYGQAKPYQIRQFLKLVEDYNLTLEDEGP